LQYQRTYQLKVKSLLFILNYGYFLLFAGLISIEHLKSVLKIIRYFKVYLFLVFLIGNGINVYAQNNYFTISREAFSETQLLDTRWEFYWQTDYAGYLKNKGTLKPAYITLPNDWCSIGHPKKGYGLYVLPIVVPGIAGQTIGINIPSICNAYNLYINQSKINAVGTFSSSAATSFPDYRPKAVTYTANSDTLVLAVEVCNYFYREGGINYSISIGEGEKIITAFHEQLLVTAFIAGALTLMFFYFIGFYLIRRNEFAALYFALLCLTSAFRILSTESILFRQVNLPISWDMLVKIEFISIILIPTFGALFLFSLLNEKRYLLYLYTLNAISTVMVVFVLFTSVYTGSHVIPFFRYFALAECLFVLFIVLVNLFTRKEISVRLAALGYIIVFLFGVNDIFYSKGLINSSYLLPFGIFGFVIIQAILMANKFAIAFVDVEKLSAELGEVNKNQERIIEDRSIELSKQSEALHKYNEIKDKIFAIIAHDLRAPIASFRAVITLADIGTKDDIEDIRRFFNELKPNVDNLTLTIDNLFVWSQSQINGITISPTAINLKNDSLKVLSLYELVSRQKSIHLAIEMSDQLYVKADPAHLDLILRNLINNALKFTKSGGQVKVMARPTISNMVLIEVIDNGVGIESEHLHLMFNPEMHYTTYGTRNEKGTGLGLRLCKEYVEKNGGTIHISSQVNVGTTIGFTLPMTTI
jgi:signal transduction histidine kinase